MVGKSDLLLLNGKAILFCGMRLCFALTFCGGISFCCLKRQRKENGLLKVTGKTSVISHHLCPMKCTGPAAIPGSFSTASCSEKLGAGACRAMPIAWEQCCRLGPCKLPGTPSRAHLSRAHQPLRHCCSLNGQEQTRGPGM